MSDTKQKQTKSDKPTVTANGPHPNCGTSACCGECKQSAKEDAKVTAYAHIKRKLN